MDAEQWTEVGCISVTPASKKRPNAVYRVQEQIATLYGKEYRAIVVHSSAHDRRREKRLEKELAQSLKQANLLAKEINKKCFFCRADAEQAVKELSAQTTQNHLLDIEIVECPCYGPGRLRKLSQRRPLG